MNYFTRHSILTLLLFLFVLNISAQEIPKNLVDYTVKNALKTFNVPGIAVGIIHNGEVVLAKGYGVTDIKTGEKVNSATNFGVASNSKAFTGAALVMLQEEGKLQLDDRVKKYIPEFKMYNDYVTEEFTIRDLLAHRSGLGLGAGDLMIWPDGHNFTPEDIINNIQYLKPVSDFRSKYDYDNLLYVIAGVVIERVSGMSWTDFIEQRFLKPLKMNRTGASWNTLADKSNAVSPHVPMDGELKVIDRYTNSIFDAAAGLYSNVDDLAKWVQLQLDLGKTTDGKQLISETGIKEMWKPVTIVPMATREPYNSLFRAYGLGFFVLDVAGKLEVTHTGGLEGMVTQIIMYPQLDLGIIVLTNQQQGAAFVSVSNTIKDYYLGIPYRDWVGYYNDLVSSRQGNAEEIVDEVWATVEKNKSVRNRYINQLPGTYRDNWFGEVSITKEAKGYRFVSARSGQLKGDLFYYKDNSFAVKWDNPYMHADAFVHLDIEDGKIIGFKMKAISPLTDFSFDFHDLDFKKD